MIPYYIFVIYLVVYVFSAIAVGLWHELVRGTHIMSWVDDEQIFVPIYNTLIAIKLWSDYNPLRKR